MSPFSRAVESILNQADRDGTFDHLRGSGKPIEWQDETFVPEDLRLAYRMLRESGCRPVWMDEGEELESDLTSLRQIFSQRWQLAVNDGERSTIRKDWQHEVDAINRRIFDYNLRVPLARFQRRHVDADTEGQLIFVSPEKTHKAEE